MARPLEASSRPSTAGERSTAARRPTTRKRLRELEGEKAHLEAERGDKELEAESPTGGREGEPGLERKRRSWCSKNMVYGLCIGSSLLMGPRAARARSRGGRL